MYHYNPIPKEIDQTNEQYILGVQANVWTEYLTSAEKIEYMILPRMPAIAEVAWTKLSEKSFEQFNAKLPFHKQKWRKKGFNYFSK